MPRFVEVRHAEWIAAPLPQVRAQFGDLEHHIRTNVHPKLRFQLLQRRADGSLRFEQRVRLLGISQRDVFERRFESDGSIVDTSVEGFNRDGSLRFQFDREVRDGRDGARVRITVRLPLPPVVGALIAPLLAAQVRREVRAAAQEDKFDLEVRGYPAAAAVQELQPAL